MSTEDKDEYWRKQAMRTGKARKIRLENEEVKRKEKDWDKKRKRLARAKVAKEDSEGNGSYQRPQELMKAVRRISRTLPNSPRKKMALVAGLAERIGLSLAKKTER